jgi:tetratricopeptide (TPR) repeat protein
MCATEEERLNQAMHEVDERLMVSLQEEEARRKRRRRWAAGGFAMTAVIAAMFTGLVLTGPNTGNSKKTQLDPERAAALCQRGWQLWQKRQLADAESKFEEAVKLDPQSTNAWNGLGWSQLNQGDSASAEKAFNRVIKLEKNHPAARNGLGWICFNRRQYGEAEKHWKPVANQASASWLGLAQLYLLKGRYDEAARWAQKLVNTQPNDALAAKLLAAAKARSLPDALKRQIEPADPIVQSPESKRGWQLFSRGNYALAIKAFRAALKKNPNEASALNGLGFCLLNTGKPDEAKPAFEQCLKIWPDGPGPLNGLARCLKAEGKTDEAIKIWKRVDENHPGPNAGTSGLAWTYLELGQHAKAVPYFERIVKANPKDEYNRNGLEQAKQGAKTPGKSTSQPSSQASANRKRSP